jgi:hypothetical protein
VRRKNRSKKKFSGKQWDGRPYTMMGQSERVGVRK